MIRIPKEVPDSELKRKLDAEWDKMVATPEFQELCRRAKYIDEECARLRASARKSGYLK